MLHYYYDSQSRSCTWLNIIASFLVKLHNLLGSGIWYLVVKPRLNHSSFSALLNFFHFFLASTMRAGRRWTDRGMGSCTGWHRVNRKKMFEVSLHYFSTLCTIMTFAFWHSPFWLRNIVIAQLACPGVISLQMNDSPPSPFPNPKATSLYHASFTSILQTQNAAETVEINF